jgi:hypothetical protein
LREGDADQEAAVRAAEHGQPVAGGQPAFDEPVGAGVEVVEHVLLQRAPTGVVPGLALLVPAPQAGDGVDAARPAPGGDLR